MKVALLLMIKNEVHLLSAWIDYHHRLFGAENIHIFDNGSDNPNTLEILNRWASRGINVSYDYSSPLDFKNKADVYLKKIRELESLGVEFFFPMDCDEFIALETAVGVSIEKSLIFKELENYKDNRHILRIKLAYDNSPLSPGKYVKSSQKKCFFTANVCKTSDHGFHDSVSFDFGRDYIVTNVVYIHHHFRLYDDYIRAARDKLTPWTTDFGRESLLRFKNESRPGYHLINALLADEIIYYIESRERFKSRKVFAIESFFQFMKNNKHILFVSDEISSFLNEDINWRCCVDYSGFSSERFEFSGWAFNDNNSPVSFIRLHLGNEISEAMRFDLVNRPDVQIVYPSAPLSCGFSVVVSNISFNPSMVSGFFISDAKDRLGSFFRLF